MSEIDYKKRCEEYERRMGIGEDDPAKEGYLVLVDILRSQNNYLRELPKQFKSLITSDDTAKKIEYKNAKDLWEGLPKMIESVSSLRITLKMDGEVQKKQYTPVSAKSIANGDV